jgi:capsid protein
VADPTKCYFLKKDPNASPLDNYWFHFSSNWREGRGVSQAASAIATIHQLEDLVQSELMASRRNSQIFCWLTQDKEPEEVIPTPFDSTTDPEDMTEEEIKRFVEEEAKEEKIVSFNRAKENSVVYEALPEGFDAKQLQMTHPNNNVQTMVDWLANRCAASLGLSRLFATGNPEDTNWRANQLFSWPTIQELQKSLEQICDWVFYRYSNWIVKKGISKPYLAEDFMDFVDWEWRGIDDISPVEHENGIRLALENNTKTYKEILGNNWKEKLEQTAYEHKWMSEHGICPPSEKMISGGQTRQSERQVEEPTTSEEEI